MSEMHTSETFYHLIGGGIIRDTNVKGEDKDDACYQLRIPRHPATQSTLIRPGIPRTSGHLFHGHSDRQSERSDAGMALLF